MNWRGACGRQVNTSADMFIAVYAHVHSMGGADGVSQTL